MKYGNSYTSSTINWASLDDIRLVFGVPSSAFVTAATLADENLILGSPPKKSYYLNSYFSGTIQSMTLLTQELSAEEVMGLYNAKFDYRNERACHCYDACPVGQNKYFNTGADAIDVPCSGQGVCLRKYDSATGLPVGGECKCSPGFSGPACEIHCSEPGKGCCTVDDDCPVNMVCDLDKNYCVSSP
jgi:hypothetical protein